MSVQQYPVAPSAGSIAVIGAGIVGMSTALHLQRMGHRVTVLDPRAPGTMTSFGNAGGIVTGAVMPTSNPELWKQVPRMLLDPMGPLTIRWRYLPQLMPWLIRFLRAGSRNRIEPAARALWPLVSRAYDEHRTLARMAGADDIVRPEGWLKVYETEAGFMDSRAERELMARCGANIRILGPDEIHQLEPGLARRFTHGLYQPDSGWVANPGRLVRIYAERFTADGGTLLAEAVRRLASAPGDSQVEVTTDPGNHRFEQVVIAAGAWSARLARTLGERIPLETERGYHLNLAREGAAELRRPTFFVDRKLVLAPMEDGIRLTSGVELAGLEAPPDFTRIKRLLPSAREVLPGLSDTITREWMGHRPSTPDSLPVIGRSPHHPGVIYAFGHGHLGLTLGPVTGRLVASIAGSDAPETDLTPFRADRF